jgi:hypothetical protein
LNNFGSPNLGDWSVFSASAPLCVGFVNPRFLWHDIANNMRLQASDTSLFDIATKKYHSMVGWQPPPIGWIKINLDGA